MKSKYAYEKAQAELNMFMAERADKKQKPTPEEDKEKAKLQRALVNKQNSFIQERKKAEAVAR